MEIILKIKGKEERLSPHEAKELFLQLKEIFEPFTLSCSATIPLRPYPVQPWESGEWYQEDRETTVPKIRRRF